MRWTLVSTFLFGLVAACGPAATTTPATTAPLPSSEAVAERSEEAAEAQAKVTALAAPYNEASYEAGRRTFGQCRSCHTIEQGGPDRVGPNLHGLFGREIGTVDGFEYSDAVQAASFTWDAAQLDQWLANPQTFLPGNRMSFAGVRNPTQRRDLIAYLMVTASEDD